MRVVTLLVIKRVKRRLHWPEGRNYFFILRAAGFQSHVVKQMKNLRQMHENMVPREAERKKTHASKAQLVLATLLKS